MSDWNPDEVAGLVGKPTRCEIIRQGIDRLPPHSAEAEQGVLGCLILAGKPAVDETVEALGDNLEAFYDLRHRLIFDACVRLATESALDTLTLVEKLNGGGKLEQCGGIQFVSSLVDSVPSAANLSYYLEIVVEKYLLRKLIQTCTDLVGKAYESQGDVAAFMDNAERQVLAIRQFERQKQEMKPMRELVGEVINQIEAYHRNQGKLFGLDTGLVDLNKMTWGLQPGSMIVIAARPSMGKTALAMQIAEVVASGDQQLPVGVFSLEMGASSLVMRMLCSRSRVNIRNVRDGFLAERDFPKIAGAAGALSRAGIWIDDSTGLTKESLCSKARRMYQKYGIRLFVIDYLQLISSARRSDNRQAEVADISRAVKCLAMELNVPIIILSQLNREIEKRPSGKPALSDLRESGAIEQDADLVGMLYHPVRDKDDPPFEDDAPVPTNLLIAKQRNGPTGEIRLMFFKQYTRFETVAKIRDIPDVRNPYSD